MTVAAQKKIESAMALARTHGPAVAYGELMQFEGPDEHGAVALARARLALDMREPDLALGHIEVARNRQADPAELAFVAGRALNNTRQYLLAADAFRDALSHQPQWLDARLNLAHVLRADGQFRNALQEFDAALDQAPNNLRALTGVASMCMELGQPARAQTHLDAACAVQPADPGIWMQSGQNLQALGEPERAVAALRRCVERAPEWADAHAALGSALQSCGQLEAAAQAYQRALALAPGQPAASAALAGVLDLQGDSRGAIDLLEPLVNLEAPAPVVLLAWSNLRENTEVTDHILGRIERAISDPHTPPELSALLCFRIADACVQRQNPALAFEHYVAANAARAIAFSTDALTAHTQHTIERIQATSAALEREDDWQPLFIVGLPRSGTSLVEQILSGHSHIEAAGEQRALALTVMADDRSRLRSLENIDTLNAIADDYRAALLAAVAPARIRRGGLCTDKMWQNFEWLWLIRQVFPRATIVHCRRDPMAVGWSVFENSFGAAPPPFSTRLDDIAAYIAHYTAIMAAWEQVGAPRTVEVRYETLVSAPEPTVRGLLAALGLEYQEDCLAVEQRERTVVTASYDQVRRPLYASSVDRWRAFEAQLAPFARRLRSYGIAVDTDAANEA